MCLGRAAGDGPQLGGVDARPDTNAVHLDVVVKARRLSLAQGRLEVARCAVRHVHSHLATESSFTFDGKVSGSSN